MNGIIPKNFSIKIRRRTRIPFFPPAKLKLRRRQTSVSTVKMNPSQGQQTSEGRHEDDAALADFLASLMDYTPTIPDELVEHYLGKSGFQCPDVRLIRLVAVATQKFIADVATDALQHCKARQSTIVKDKRDKQQKDKRLTLTMDDLSKSLREILLQERNEVMPANKSL